MPPFSQRQWFQSIASARQLHEGDARPSIPSRDDSTEQENEEDTSSAFEALDSSHSSDIQRRGAGTDLDQDDLGEVNSHAYDNARIDDDDSHSEPDGVGDDYHYHDATTSISTAFVVTTVTTPTTVTSPGTVTSPPTVTITTGAQPTMTVIYTMLPVGAALTLGSQQPQRGIQPTATTTPFPLTEPLAAVDPTLTSSFGIPYTTDVPDHDSDSDGEDFDHHYHHDDDDGHGPPGLDSTAEHLLIAAGAIGAFILVCFVSWVCYRVFKRSNGGGGRSGSGLSDKIPWRRGEGEGENWDDRTTTARGPPPTYEQGNVNDMEAAGYYGADKAYPPGPGSVARSAVSQQQRQGGEGMTGAIAAQYMNGGDGTMQSSDSNLTTRSRMPDAFYNQSEMARQPSNAYDPDQRQVYRASELSSISSGFGDGDIVMPPPATEPSTNSRQQGPREPSSYLGRFSFMSKRDERRETMYTATSEDRPARFRTVTSWVNQQTGRVMRAGSRAEERGEVPVMPAVPGENNRTQQTSYR
ncbi:hypothetical protein F4780DRAFT_777020 [Xylariomycetidae sp. FL0641]|nr:hypothetical protein F4780DRAFT_777020 [Xylariomycetidae sp. FL0641]